MNTINYTVAESGNCNNTFKPIIFEIGTLAELFFKDEGVQSMYENEFLELAEVKTIDNERAVIVIALNILSAKHFKLHFMTVTTRGIENLTIYEQLTDLCTFKLKTWMYIALCDKMRKTIFISDFPEYYRFDTTRLLA